MGSARLGILGFGAMGQKHLAAAQRCAFIEGIQVFDPSSSPGRIPEDVHAQTVDELMRVSTHLVVVAPPAHHAQLAMSCLKAGKPCLLEKPCAADLEAFAHLAATSESESTRLVPAMVERFNPALGSLQPGKLGPPGEHISIWAVRQVQGPDRHQIGPAWDLLIHDLDLIAWLLDVSPREFQLKGISAVEDGAGIYVELSHGATTLGLTAAHNCVEAVRTLTFHRLDQDIVCDLGRVSQRQIAYAPDSPPHGVTTVMPVGLHDALEMQLELFIEADESMAFSLERFQALMGLLQTIDDAAANQGLACRAR